MFTKLLKHEWKASAGLLGIMSVCALGVGVVGAVLMHFMVSGVMDDNLGLSVTIIFTVFFLYLALIAYALGSQIMLLYRFYKNKFSDEGYLTFTLPVRSWQIFLSAYVNNVIWLLIVALVTLTSVFIVAFGAVAGTGIQFAEVKGAIELIQETELTQIMSAQLLLSGVSFVSGVCLMMSCITIGSVMAKKHKILASIGIYYALSMIMGLISSVSMAVYFVQANDVSTLTGSMDAVYGLQALLYGAFAVAGFFLSTYLMDKKLNLP